MITVRLYAWFQITAVLIFFSLGFGFIFSYKIACLNIQSHIYCNSFQCGINSNWTYRLVKETLAVWLLISFSVLLLIAQFVSGRFIIKASQRSWHHGKELIFEYRSLDFHFVNMHTTSGVDSSLQFDWSAIWLYWDIWLLKVTLSLPVMH